MYSSRALLEFTWTFLDFAGDSLIKWTDARIPSDSGCWVVALTVLGSCSRATCGATGRVKRPDTKSAMNCNYNIIEIMVILV